MKEDSPFCLIRAITRTIIGLCYTPLSLAPRDAPRSGPHGLPWATLGCGHDYPIPAFLFVYLYTWRCMTLGRCSLSILCSRGAPPSEVPTLSLPSQMRSHFPTAPQTFPKNLREVGSANPESINPFEPGPRGRRGGRQRVRGYC